MSRFGATVWNQARCSNCVCWGTPADLGWVPQITLQEMVQEMVASDLHVARQHALLSTHGYTIATARE